MQQIHITELYKYVTHMQIADKTIYTPHISVQHWQSMPYSKTPTIYSIWDDRFIEELDKIGWTWCSDTRITERSIGPDNKARYLGIRFLRREDGKYVIQVAQPIDKQVEIVFEPISQIERYYHRFDYVDFD